MSIKDTPEFIVKSRKYDAINVGFKHFLSQWNQRQNMQTPYIHLEIVDWLELRWNKKKPREQLHMLLMAFRSCGKSTLVAVFAAWLLYRHQDLRILVLAADSKLATKMVRNIKRIIERHPQTQDMKPAKADEWASDRFTIHRDVELRDPSVIAYGITANITGARADIIICDDVEVPNTCDTADKREELRERLLELDYILVPGGMQLYAGTPHSYYSIYAEHARQEIGEDKPFLNGYQRLVKPILDAEGHSAWPERFREEDIQRMKNNTGVNKFTSQMMLQPVNIMEGRLDPKLLKQYEGEISYIKELCRLEINNIEMTSVSAFWDPAFGSPKGDGSVVAVVFIDAEHNYYLHRLVYLKNDPHSQKDAATQQCRTVAQLSKDLILPSLWVEANGIGKFLPNILRQEMCKINSLCRVLEIFNKRTKDIRILEAFDIAMASGRLHIHSSVLKTQFLNEMQEWAPGKASARDDGLDAVAGAIAAKPMPFGASPMMSNAHSWTKSAKPSKAKTDFQV